MIEYGADDLGFQPTGDLPLGIVVPVVPGGNDTGCDIAKIYNLRSC